jgi:hypothetical protein
VILHTGSTPVLTTKTKVMKPRFYLRVIKLTFVLFPKWVNKCLVFDGWKLPYVCDTNDIRGDLSFIEFKV